MRALILHFLLLFAVLGAGMHAPAIAHPETAATHVDAGHHGDDASHFDDENEDRSSADLGNETLSHPHFPTGMVEDGSDMLNAPLLVADTPVTGPVTALRSYAAPPPIEPPLA